MVFNRQVGARGALRPAVPSLSAREALRPSYAATARLWRDFERNIGNIGDPTVTAASTRYAKTKAGVYVPFAANTPARTDDGLQVAPTGANIIPNSLDIAGSYTVGANCTAANDQPDPLGVANRACTITDTGNGDDRRQRNQPLTSSSNTKWWVTSGCVRRVYTAPANYPAMFADMFGASTTIARCTINPQTGEIAYVGTGTWSVELVVDPSGVEWWRMVHVQQNTLSNTHIAHSFYPAFATSFSTIQSAPATGAHVFAWPEIKEGQFSTPPILTNGSAVTVAGDQAVYHLAGKLDVSQGIAAVLKVTIGQPTVVGFSPRLFEINDGTNNNYVSLFRRDSTGNIALGVAKANVSQGTNDTGVPFAAGTYVFGLAVGTDFMLARGHGASAPLPDLSVDYPSTLTKAIPGGTGYNAGSNMLGVFDKLALFDGPMDQARWDNQIWPAALAMAAAA